MKPTKKHWILRLLTPESSSANICASDKTNDEASENDDEPANMEDDEESASVQDVVNEDASQEY